MDCWNYRIRTLAGSFLPYSLFTVASTEVKMTTKLQIDVFDAESNLYGRLIAVNEPVRGLLIYVCLGRVVNLGIGVIHSHPEGYRCLPSIVDDEMDEYFSSYFQELVGARPYVSLIVGRHDGVTYLSGRVFWKNLWHTIDRFFVQAELVRREGEADRTVSPEYAEARARLVSVLGKEAATRLARSVVGIVGAGGTGSPVVELLARAGVGCLIVIDPDHLAKSNLERVHGSVPDDASAESLKVAIALRHVAQIAPSCEVIALRGALPQAEIIDALMCADLVLGCTDQHHSRLALSDLSTRFLVPVIDTGALAEGRDGRVTGLIMQIVRYCPDDPCAYCRRAIDAGRLSRELMTPEERERRRKAAALAIGAGVDASGYWVEDSQLNTVGFLTSAVASIAAGYAIGYLTRRFEMPGSRLQADLVAPNWTVDDFDRDADPNCQCRRTRGRADQTPVLISPPDHWPPVSRVVMES